MQAARSLAPREPRSSSARSRIDSISASLALRAGSGLARRLAFGSSACGWASTSASAAFAASTGSLVGGIENNTRRMNACSASSLAGCLSGRGGAPMSSTGTAVAAAFGSGFFAAGLLPRGSGRGCGFQPSVMPRARYSDQIVRTTNEVTWRSGDSLRRNSSSGIASAG